MRLFAGGGEGEDLGGSTLSPPLVGVPGVGVGVGVGVSEGLLSAGGVDEDLSAGVEVDVFPAGGVLVP